MSYNLISIVAPVYNEEENINYFYRELKAVLTALKKDYEIILVNDGSRDSSLIKMIGLQKNDPAIKIIDLSRNFGHQIAISAGLNHAIGDLIVIMDSDLQDPPAVIPDLIKKHEEGFDVVYAVRRKRKENIFKRTAYSAFYRILNKICELDIPLDAGDFCLMTQRVATELKNIPEKNRFVRGIRTWVGFKQVGLEYERQARHAGQEKYTWIKLFKLAFDGIFSFSYFPLRLSSIMGLVVSAASFIIIIYFFIARVIDENSLPGFASTRIIILFVGGIQLIILGVIGEYLARIYDEVRGRPLYIIRQIYQQPNQPPANSTNLDYPAR
ncbi:TPA: glycosyltransferase [Candidatus Falkowbacteria bacterium]|nr:glycosyltransferase [Candidatus Falkowbacteria bacterium]